MELSLGMNSLGLRNTAALHFIEMALGIKSDESKKKFEGLNIYIFMHFNF